MDQGIQSTGRIFAIPELARRLGGKIKNFLGGSDLPAGLSIDTRTLAPGNVFVAIRGKKLDGHAFITRAKNRGAGAFVVDSQFFAAEKSEDAHNLIVVADTTKALQKLAASVRDDFKGPVVGITGSSGKTTTKEITRAFLKSRWNLLASEGNQNNYIGLPLTLLKCDASYEALLAELGASYPGEIGELCDILKPDWGIITNVYPCHLEGFGTLDNIYQTKIELGEKIISRGGTVAVNGDDNRLLELVKEGKGRRITFGTSSDCDFALTQTKPYATGMEFVVNGKHNFRIETRGQFNVMNALGAIALAASMGFKMGKLAEILETHELPKSRFQLIASPQGIRIIDDAYNSNPTSLRLAIESFEEMKADGRKVLVAADMLELGERKKEFHRSLGEGVAHKNIDVVVTVGPLMREFLAGLHSVLDRRPVTYGFDNNEETREFLKAFLKSGDLVLFKGSRSMKLEEIIQCFMPSYIR